MPEPPETEVAKQRPVRLVFGGLLVSVFMATLDQTVLSAALPTVVGDLGGIGLLSWVTTAYILAATVVMPAYGRLGDLMGRKGLFLSAIGLFVAGSAIGGFAPSIGWLIAGRVVQGLGGGGLVITAQAIIADVLPPRQRARYTGVLGSVFALTSVGGPLVGGWFTDVAGWRWCFWINIPLGVASFAVAALVLRLPAGTARRPQLDVAGMACCSVAVTALVLLATWAGTRYAWTSPEIVGLALLTVAATLLCVRAERRAAEPVFPFALFRDRTVVLATAAGLLVGVGLFAVSSYLPTFLQMAGGRGATSSGLQMLPMMAGILVASTVSGFAISATGRYRVYPIAGLVLCAVAVLLMATMHATTPGLVVGLYLVLFGAGIGFVLQVLALVVQNAVRQEVVGSATATHNFFREIGASLGTAVVGSVFTARLTAAITAGPAASIGTAGLTPGRPPGCPTSSARPWPTPTPRR